MLPAIRLTFIFFLLLAFLPGLAHDDDNTRNMLQGTVVDRNGAPVEGVTVRLKGTVRGTTTNREGLFSLRGLPDGNYTLVISAVDIKPQEKTITLRQNQLVSTDFIIEENTLELAEIRVRATKGLRELERLPNIDGTAIFAGKKTEVINLNQLDANLVTNNTRQIFSKTPGVMIWENDGSGVQVGVAVRGLSPNRSWEFNVRQNGYDISSDPFGYPEAYYNPPMEAVDQIQLVRGAASLQFGPQFGGLLNYVMKKPSAKPFSFETQQSTGSFGLFSTYNAVSGTVGRFSYVGYAHYRRADGWRENSRYGIFNGYANLQYAVTNKLKLGFELSRLYNESQQPGGLTDAQFAENARQSFRGRNWFSTPWTVPVLTAEYNFSDKTRLTWKAHGLIGERNSIGFVRSIDTPDRPGANGQLANRQIDRDLYRNWGSELRFLTEYDLLGTSHTLAAGLKYFNGYTRRKQSGRGDNGADFNLNLQETAFPRDLDLRVQNVAAFAENIFNLTPRWTLTPGLRLETFANTVDGRLSFAANGAENRVSQTSSRRLLLLGLGSEYKLSSVATLYANYSQAYRPLLFSDLTPAAVTDFEIDPNIRDARGYNIDLGLRGSYRNFLNYDVSYFYMAYNDRVGTLTLLNAGGRPFQYRTNLGNSVSRGVEAYVEFDPVVAFFGKSKVGYLSLFTSASYTDARYLDLRSTTVVNGQVTETNLRDRRVENAPVFIGRFGANYSLKSLTITALLNRVGKAYSDANNTEAPSVNGQTGVIPAYQVLDLSATWQFARRYNIRAGVNNLTDERYFTRRAGGYPGPGLLPGDGRNWFVSVGMKL